MNVKKRHLLSLCIVLVYVCIVYFVSGIYFQTNDDRAFAEILSGSMTGKPDAHVIYINYILSYLMMLPYYISNTIPWFGIFSLLFVIIALYIMVDSIFSKVNDKFTFYMCFCVALIILLSNYYSVSTIQYTSTAMLLAIGGYFALIVNMKEMRRHLPGFFLIELLAYLLRGNAMLLVQPFGAAVLIGFFITDKKYKIRSEVYNILLYILSLCSIVVISYIGNYIGYSSNEWIKYDKYNEVRTELYDYYGFPQYNDIKDILDKYDVSELEYLCYRNYVMLDDDLSTECLNEVVQYMKELNPKSISLSDIFEELVRGEYNQLNIYLYLTWIMVIGYSIIFKRHKNILPLLGILFFRFVIWIYLLYNGRIPVRVTYPFLCSELIILYTVLLYDFTAIKKIAIMKYLYGVTVVCALFGACVTGYLQYKTVHKINATQKIYAEALVEVKQYCADNPLNQYILDNSTFCSGNGHIFETRIYDNSNYVYTGGWYSFSPILNERINEYLDWENSNGKIHFIVLDMPEKDIPFGSYEYAKLYISEKTGRTPKLVDTLILATGAEYLVFEY